MPSAPMRPAALAATVALLLSASVVTGAPEYDYKAFSRADAGGDWSEIVGSWCASTEQSPIDMLRPSELSAYLPLPEGFGPISISEPVLPGGETRVAHTGYAIALRFPPAAGMEFGVAENKTFTALYGEYTGTGPLGNDTEPEVSVDGEASDLAESIRALFNGSLTEPDTAVTQDAMLVNIHLHVPSEHTINGRLYAAEIHFVHFVERPGDPDCTYMSGDDGPYCIAVLGVLYDTHVNSSERMATVPHALDGLIAALKPLPRASENGNGTVVETDLDLEELLPPEGQREFWTYRGSLTTPDCNENVTWTVLQTPVPMEWSNYVELRDATLEGAQLGDRDARPPLPLNQRVVFVSNYETGGVVEDVVQGISDGGNPSSEASGLATATLPLLASLAAAWLWGL